MARFYQRVRDNAVLGPVFAQMGSEHPQHVAAFLAEVLPKWGWGEVKGPYVPGS